jgi:hypothetical protein
LGHPLLYAPTKKSSMSNTNIAILARSHLKSEHLKLKNEERSEAATIQQQASPSHKFTCAPSLLPHQTSKCELVRKPFSNNALASLPAKDELSNFGSFPVSVFVVI